MALFGDLCNLCSPKQGYFRHPMGLWHALKDVVGSSGYTDDNEAYVVLQSDKDPHEEVLYLPHTIRFVVHNQIHLLCS